MPMNTKAAEQIPGIADILTARRRIDGLRAIVGVLNFEIIRNTVDSVITVSESGIVDLESLPFKS